jgi:hypothetical protein
MQDNIPLANVPKKTETRREGRVYHNNNRRIKTNKTAL